MDLRARARLMLGFTGLTLIGSCWSSARGETWAEKLGYPAGARVVILSAHEMGVSWEMNDAGKELLSRRAVQSASVVVTGPWLEDFAAWCHAHPDYDIGLNFALTNPHDQPQWRLLSRQDPSCSLADAEGLPWKTVYQLACSATAEDVARELHAQIARARAVGLPLTHISGYYGTVFCRTDLAAVLLQTSQKFWIPTPVVELTPAHLERFRSQGFPLQDDLVALVHNYPLPKVDDIRFPSRAETYEQKRDELCRLLSSLEPGLTAFVFHPAVASPGLERMTDDWQQRVWERDVLLDDEVQKTLKAQRIQTTNWREIMRRFEGQPADEPEVEAPHE